MKKINIKYRLLLIVVLFSFFTINITAQVEGVKITVQNLIQTLGGNLIDGEIKVDNLTSNNINVDITLFPSGLNCPQTFQPIGNSFILPISIFCTGEWCFSVTKDVGLSTECMYEVCVTVLICKEEWVGNGTLTNPSATRIKCEGVKDRRDFKNDTPPSVNLNKIGNPVLESILEESSNLKDGQLFVQHVFPNPFINEINFQILLTSDESIDVKLIDLFGQTVLDNHFEVLKEERKITIRLDENLPDGNYFLNVTTSSGLRHIQKLVRIADR